MALFWMGFLAWSVFLVTISAATAACYPVLRGRVADLHPSPRAALLRVVATGPVALASLGVFLCFAPKLLGGFFPRLDHCFEHADGHAHFCFTHPPHMSMGMGGWMALALVGAAILLAFTLSSWRLLHSMRSVRQLTSTARFDPHRRAWLVDSDSPVAMSVGIARSKTILSSGLLRIVPAPLVDAIVQHERAHERRRDGLWMLLAEALSRAHLPHIRRALLADLELACEQACDEDAGVALGSRVQVAEALVAVERLRHRTASLGPVAVPFEGGGLPSRVESLLAESAGRRWDRREIGLLLAAIGILVIVTANPLHHFTETLLHHILG